MNMTKKSKKYYLAISLSVLFIVFGYVIYVTYIKPFTTVKKPIIGKEFITIYYYNPDTDTLVPEQREVSRITDLLNRCRKIISELEQPSTKGFVSPIPIGVKINSAKLQSGILYLDLNNELIEKTPEGSSTEITAIYSIVNSLAKNIEGINAVEITIKGKLLQTLKTHIEIDQPIVPDYTK